MNRVVTRAGTGIIKQRHRVVLQKDTLVELFDLRINPLLLDELKLTQTTH